MGLIVCPMLTLGILACDLLAILFTHVYINHRSSQVLYFVIECLNSNIFVSVQACSTK